MPVLPSVELGVSVDPVDGLDVLGHDGKDLLLSLRVGLLLFPDMFPQEWICLDKQRTRLLGNRATHAPDFEGYWLGCR